MMLNATMVNDASEMENVLPNVSVADTSIMVKETIPASIQGMAAAFLTMAVLYGTIGNTLLLVLLLLHADTRKYAGSLLCILIVVNIVHSAVPAFTFLMRILDVFTSLARVRAVCNISTLGSVFAGAMNFMIISSMAVQRYCLVISHPVGHRFVVTSVVAMTVLAVVFTVNMSVRPSFAFHMCVYPRTSGVMHVKGTSTLTGILMMLSLITCCGLIIVMYVRIYRLVVRNVLLYNINRLLVQPLFLMFAVYLMSYVPLVLVLILQHIFPSGATVINLINSRFVVIALNMLSHAVSPSIYCLRLLRKQCSRLRFKKRIIKPVEQPCIACITVKQHKQEAKKDRNKAERRKSKERRKNKKKRKKDQKLFPLLDLHNNPVISYKVHSIVSDNTQEDRELSHEEVHITHEQDRRVWKKEKVHCTV